MRTAFAALMIATAPAALFAAPVVAPATVTAVTLFPQGAQVTRTVVVPAAGEIIIPDLPDQTDPASLRLSGVPVGAVTLMDARQPAQAGDSPAVAAAREKVATLQAALDQKTDAIAALRAEATAADASVQVLRNASTQGVGVADLPTFVQAVSKGVLEAEKAAIAARARVRAAEAGLAPERDALEQAQRELTALQHPAEEGDSLLLTAAGPGTLVITTFVQDAGWSPAYDLRLDSGAGTLAVDRFASVHQASGEDWSGVDLTLSTARPAERTGASELMPEQVRAGVDQPMVRAAAPMMEMAKAGAFAADEAPMEMLGQTVTYHYPQRASVRDGVENLRLTLAGLNLPVTQVAQAVPMLDTTAYRQVEGRNSATEPLLPGAATLFVDGAMVGTSYVPLVAGGDKFTFGFGAIDGLKLTRTIAQASEGDRGVISKSNERVEAAKIGVENLTGRAWPVRVIDRVPYSEQDALKVTWTADPRPATTDWEDKRGLLAWTFDLPAGARQDIALTTTLKWPAGQVLQ